MKKVAQIWHSIWESAQIWHNTWELAQNFWLGGLDLIDQKIIQVRSFLPLGRLSFGIGLGTFRESEAIKGWVLFFSYFVIPDIFVFCE